MTKNKNKNLTSECVKTITVTIMMNYIKKYFIKIVEVLHVYNVCDRMMA